MRCVIAAACVVACCLGCKERDAPTVPYQPAPPSASQPAVPPATPPASASDPFAGYAGSVSCAECHQEAFDEWRSSHHANAQRGLVSELDHEAFVPLRAIEHGSQVSFAAFADGVYTLTTTGRDGQPHDYHPAGVIGVDPLWQYLIPQDDGRLQVAELAYDPANKEWFDVYGREDRQHWEWGHWSQRGMNWNAMCATCHTTAYQKNYDPASDGYRSCYLEQGVGCEQCHGPMKPHVDWQATHPEESQRSQATGERLDPTIIEFQRDDYVSACAACHARRSDLGGRFAAGSDFIEHYEPVLPDVTDTFYPDGQVRDEDFEYAAFTMSYMYAWGVRCMDCHYWHSGKIAKRDNTLCLRCHRQGISTKRPIDPVEHSHHPLDKPGFLCKDCHMPQTVYMARHWRHDHGMTIPDPLLTKEHGIPNACTRCHQKEGVDWSIQYVEQWYGQRMDRPTRTRARVLARIKAGTLDAAREVLPLLPDEKNATWRAVYLRFLRAVLGSSRDAGLVEAVVRELLRCLDDPSPLVQATAIESIEPLPPAVTAAPLTVKLDSPHRLVRTKAAWACRRWLDLDSPAGRDLRVHLDYNQDQPLGAMQWASFYADTGRFAEALPWYAKAIRWDVALAPARHGLATALQALGRSDQAADVLLEGSHREPDNPLYPYWLGLLYSEMGEAKAARDALRSAVTRDGSQARFWYNLALAELALNETDAALAALDRAEQLDPAEPHYPFTRGTIYHQLKQPDRAREALERALAIDPGYQQAAELLGEL